jgi:serine phosphatase RsbU (regulator of sigma subunit)
MLLSAFRDNICIALENARLLLDSLEKEHFKREFLLAREMQKKLLPQTVPTIENYSIAAFSTPAEEIGGDYYDFIQLKDDSIAVIIGDVSGKGMNAAFYMAQMKGVVLSVAKDVKSATDLLKGINRNLYQYMDKQMFITLSAVVINRNNNKVYLARAGHTPIIYKSNGSINVLTPKGMGIGLSAPDFFDENLDCIELNLMPDDLILLFTDGVNELNTYEGIEFGVESIKEFCSKANYENSNSLLFDIKKILDNKLNGKLQRDDITVVSIIYKGLKIGLY